MSPASSGLKLRPDRWYAWQMIPGYADGVPYFSPIFVWSSTLVAGDPNLRRLKFFNLLYAQGVQGFEKVLRPVLWGHDYVLAQLVEPEQAKTVRSAVISKITFEWVERCCPSILKDYPPRTPPDGSQLTIEAYLALSFNMG